MVTFDRHPASVVRPEPARHGCSPTSTRSSSCWPTTGVDRCLVIAFDEARSREPAEDFVREILVDRLGARLVIVGEDFHFGHQRRGDVALLRSMGGELGFEVEGIELVEAPGAGGAGVVDRDPPRARRGRPPAGHGRCSAGPTRSAASSPTGTSGAASSGSRPPTCRSPGEILLPADGIYAGWFERADGSVWPTAISLGRRPTFYAEAHVSLLEAHVLDFTGDLYDEAVRVRFVARLRGEVKFDSVDALVEQIGRDCIEARRILTGSPDPHA